MEFNLTSPARGLIDVPVGCDLAVVGSKVAAIDAGRHDSVLVFEPTVMTVELDDEVVVTVCEVRCLVVIDIRILTVAVPTGQQTFGGLQTGI